MGVTLRRLGLLVLVLAAILLPLATRDGRPSTVQPDDRGLRLRELQEDVAAARMHWSALVERDSALAIAATLDKGGAAPLVNAEGFPVGLHPAQAESTVAALWHRIGTLDTAVRTAVLIYNRAGYSTWGWNLYWGNLIANTNGATACVAIVPGEIWQGHLVVGRELLNQAVAPCALYASFGVPGAGMRDWLQATRFMAARSNSWLGAARSRVEGDGDGPWARWYSIREAESAWSESFSLARAVGGVAIASLLAPPYEYGASGIRCLDGDGASCRNVVLHPAIPMEGDTGFPRDLTVSGGALASTRITLTTPRPPAPFFVSDMIRALDRPLFLALWKSERSFEDAFQNAFGEPVGAWTGTWAKRVWLNTWEAKYRSRSIILGPDLHPSWPLIVVGWTCLALAAVAWIAQRQQVT